MTRFLASVLGAKEPWFSQSVRRLEQAGGMPNADIQLTSEIKQRIRQKIIQLGLDPDDTTGPELYHALQQRLADDEKLARAALKIASNATAADVLAGVRDFLESYNMPKACFALKTSAAKRLLKKKVPKNVMKRLGYRSADSMLKNEPVLHLYAAATLLESASWNKALREAYRKAIASDFEVRPMQFALPKTKRWLKLAGSFVTQNRQPMLGFPELGAIVFLPADEQVDGLAITALMLGLNEANMLRSYSSFLKLQQVRPDFGAIVRDTCASEPQTGAELAGQPVPWRMIQRYYGQSDSAYHPEVFEPHVQREDLIWHQSEQALAGLEPALSFWQDTQFLAVLHEGQPVSLNALDSALSYCNQLPFSNRIVHFMRDNVWHELMARYLHQDNLEEAVHRQLGAGLAANPELALAEQEL